MGKYDKALNRLVLLGIVLIASFIVLFAMDSESANYSDVNVTSKVNITNAYPVISKLRVDQNILLSAGTTKKVYCNLSAYDWNGFGDIISVNATLWDNSSVTMNSADNNNTHYTNASCTYNVTGSVYYANYSCVFDVWYYANATQWVCNATIMDTWNFTGTLLNTTNVQAFYAINVTPLIDFGQMFLASYSDNVSANITNFGNKDINVSVYGYGGTNPATGNGLAMVCQNGGNITVGNQRYSVNNSADWVGKIPLTSTNTNISLSVPKRVTDLVWNYTYWQLYTDPTNAPFGLCNGTVVFTAEVG